MATAGAEIPGGALHAAFDRHIRPRLPWIRALVAQKTHRRAHFEDHLQATLIHLFLRADRCAQAEHAGAWVERTVSRLMAALNRRAARTDQRWADAAVEDLAASLPAETPTEAWTAGFEAALRGAEGPGAAGEAERRRDAGSAFCFEAYTRRDLLRAVMGLAPHYREVLLRHIDGATYADIGREMGLSASAARHVGQRALVLLRRVLGG